VDARTRSETVVAVDPRVTRAPGVGNREQMRQMLRWWRLASGLLCAWCLVVALSSCSRHRQLATPNEEESVVLVVDNRNWQDVVIYAVHDGSRSRLGLVVTARTATFTLPPSYVTRGGDLYFIADPVGATRSYSSERIVVQLGQYIEWTLESGLERSSLLVR
jgi:hypothetical protein